MPKGHLSYPAYAEVKTHRAKEKGDPDSSPHIDDLPGEGRERPVIYPPMSNGERRGDLSLFRHLRHLRLL